MAGRVTKYTAAALLGKYYMFIGEKAKAKTEFWKVIDSHRYELMENYGDNFNGLHENNKESILEVQFTGSLEGGHYEYNLFTLHWVPTVLWRIRGSISVQMVIQYTEERPHRRWGIQRPIV